MPLLVDSYKVTRRVLGRKNMVGYVLVWEGFLKEEGMDVDSFFQLPISKPYRGTLI